MALFAIFICATMQDLVRANDPSVPLDSSEVVELVICLDTSNSMEDLLDSARLRLWEIVNDLARVEPTPRLRVGLLTYGNGKNDYRQGWVKVETPLTEDLDLVAERLLELSCTGGMEYVGRALKTAIETMDWTPSDDSLKMIFVAGNETVDSDPSVSFRDMSREVLAQGIVLSAVYQGRADDEDARSWKEMAELADGHFAVIDPHSKPVLEETPFDADLAKLSEDLTRTYIPLGEEGASRQRNQVQQDQSSRGMGLSVAAARAETKARRIRAESWDLVGSFEAEIHTVDDLEALDLPKSLQDMTLTEREIYLQEMVDKRAALRQDIMRLSKARREYIREQAETSDLGTSSTFDSVVRESIRQRLEERGLVLKYP
jgi:hypothetical protein